MENYQNPDNQFRAMNNMQMNAQGASSLSVNAPEFVPGTSGMPIMVQGYPGGPPGVGQEWPPHGIPPHQFNQPQQFPFTPYSPQQPIPELQSFALTQRVAQMSINNRLSRYNHGPTPMIPDFREAVPGNNHPMSNGLSNTGGFGGGPPQHVVNGRRPRGGGGGGPGTSHYHGHKPHHQTSHHHAAAAAAHNDDYEDAPHQPTETEDQALNYLTEVINKLETDPGTFDQYQKRLKEIFFELAGNHFVMSNSLEMLFKQSIKSQNFRYMGARICHLLDDLESSEQSYFRKLLRLKMDFERQEIMSFMSGDQHRVRGTTLFLAELYMQLRRPSDNYRNIEIADSIQFSINLLLSRATPENLKCVCQTLKLCGFELDLDCSEKMEHIMMTLNHHKNGSDTSTGRLIQSVLDLRSKRWGRSDTFNSPEVISNQDYNDGPVFYGPDGQILTEEENSFLAASLPTQLIEDLVECDSGEELVDDDDNAYDLEIQLAFKEFVNSNKNTSAAAANSNNSTSTGSKQN